MEKQVEPIISLAHRSLKNAHEVQKEVRVVLKNPFTVFLGCLVLAEFRKKEMIL